MNNETKPFCPQIIFKVYENMSQLLNIQIKWNCIS